jgi:hypothetical protein
MSGMDASAPEAGAPVDAGGRVVDAGDAGLHIDAAIGGDDSDAGPEPPCAGSVNACGGCEALSDAPGSPCGTCGLGVNECSGADAIGCMGGAATPTTDPGSLVFDDFEDGDREFRAGPIHGEWYLVSDPTSGTLNPATDDALIPQSPGANSSTRALHVSGNGFTQWGAGIQASLNYEGCYVNAAAQTGVSFYARGTGTLQVSVATKQTVPTADGGTCVGTCYDNFATALMLTNTWKPYQIPWTTLHQAGWGTPATFMSSQLKYLQLSFAAGSSLDLYLDDVALY